MFNVVRIRQGKYRGLAAYLTDIANGAWKIFIPSAGVIALVDDPLEMLSYDSVVIDLGTDESLYLRAAAQSAGRFELLRPTEPEAEEVIEDLLAVDQNRVAEAVISRAFPDNDRRFDNIIPGAIGSRLAGALDELTMTEHELSTPEIDAFMQTNDLATGFPIRPATVINEEYPDAAGFAIIRKRNDNGEPVPFFGYRCWWTADYPVPGIARPYPRYLVRVILPPNHPQAGREIYRNYFEPDLEFEAMTPEQWGGRAIRIIPDRPSLRLADLHNDSDWPRAV
jgi:hypothetical protein